ncbi:hypothetical protein [Brevibacillus reuszeri]|uniref:hypothetical protein n=1 Tax=Brevibacillus reuszeri TaxID=54915 RepID=UPI0013E0933C|nr:hypothetical protein [Brevibacillus reuszeri]
MTNDSTASFRASPVSLRIRSATTRTGSVTSGTKTTVGVAFSTLDTFLSRRTYGSQRPFFAMPFGTRTRDRSKSNALKYDSPSESWPGLFAMGYRDQQTTQIQREK